MSRQKGKRGEREAAAELGAILNVEARRGVQYQGGPESPDVVLDGVPIHVEAKRVEAFNVYKAIEQATSDAGSKVPMVWHRRNGKPSVVVVETSRLWDLAHALMMSRRWREGETIESRASDYEKTPKNTEENA